MVSTDEPVQRFWMAIESYSNWVADKENGFRFTGVTEYRSTNAARVNKNDMVFIYVPSPECAFSDVRRVMQGGLSRSSHAAEYDIPCSQGILTASLIVLDENKWVPIKKLVGKLSFIRLTVKWGYALRHSFRELNPDDAALIVNQMAAVAPSSRWPGIMAEISVAKGASKPASRNRNQRARPTRGGLSNRSTQR